LGPRRATTRGSPRGAAPRNNLERETGIEPATNSLEGCDSTTELLPPSRLATDAVSTLRRGSPPSRLTLNSALRRAKPVDAPKLRYAACSHSSIHSPARWASRSSLSPFTVSTCQPWLARCEGRARLMARGGFEPPKPLGRQIYSLLRLTAPQPRPTVLDWTRVPVTALWTCLSRVSPQFTRGVNPAPRSSRSAGPECPLRVWSWRRDLNPRPADYKSAALPD